MAEMVTCNGCGREAEMEYEPDPGAERDVPVLPTGWESVDNDEYYCQDCVVKDLREDLERARRAGDILDKEVMRLRGENEELQGRFEEAARISHEMRDERNRLQTALTESTNTVGRLEGEHGVFVESTDKTIRVLRQENEKLESQLVTVRHDLGAANEAFEANSRRLIACKQEVEKLTEMRRVGHVRRDALLRRAYVEHVGDDWLKECESVLGLSKTMTRQRPLRDPGEVRSVPGEVLTLELKGGQVQAWITTTGVMCMKLVEPPKPEVIICPECGPVENTDEEACCLSCGADCTIEPAYEYWQQLAEKFGRRGDILNDHLRQVMAPIEDLRKKVEDARHDQEKDLVWEVDDLDEFLCDIFGTCNDCSHYAGADGDGECHNDESDHHGEHRTDQPMCKDAG
jgi:hypothetical protein